MNKPQVPRVDSIQELAHFWDTHDVTDFADELEEVGERVFEREGKITVELSAQDASAVRALAKSRGVPDSELIREWVLDKLHTS